ncbi:MULTISPECIES: hypothetical protein [unclassified Microbacterium]|uniref:hypothetical protein n=1 Tax=unclassified Microbacterium TaxID=2609290 RepID=UPI001AD0D15B|nr:MULTISPECIES: hypothetical protein [unclassified Microbacterium]MBN9224258.1 hypothetical protein [Microbacterium sp.]
MLHIPVALSQPVGLSEAIDIAEASSMPIVGYRFENDGVVGEYFPNGQQPEEFRQTYIADFGMEPRIVGLVKEVAVDFDAKPGAERSPETLEVDAGLSARYNFGTSREGKMWDRLAAGLSAADSLGVLQDPIDQAGITEETSEPLAQRSTLALSWEPTFARFDLRDTSAGKARIVQEYVWSEPGYDPALRDLDTALEFEINQHNDNILLTGVRPNCFSWNYQDHFWAKNSGYTWGVASWFGFSYGIGAYADTNDLTDSCYVQSMAIGISNPGNIGDDGYGNRQVALWMLADGGALAADSEVSGVIQAVEKLSCDNWPWNGQISTDCVGLNTSYTYSGYGPTYYTTLSRSRGFRAPEKCWQTSRVKMQWEPGKPEDQVYTGPCSDMFGPVD